jgi:hypothetical protein
MQIFDRANAQLAQHSLQIRVVVIEVATPDMIREERRRESLFGNPPGEGSGPTRQMDSRGNTRAASSTSGRPKRKS